MRPKLLTLLVTALLLLGGLACSFTANQVEPIVQVVSPMPPTPTTAAPITDKTGLAPASAPPELAAQAATPVAEMLVQPAAAAYGPTGFPAGVDPLTGVTVADATTLERRPGAVKIQLFPRGGRPPYGISAADIVYDYYQNFGMTRLHAIFYGNNAEKVGPIRSARLLDIDLIHMYKTVFAFGSAEQRTYSKLFNQEFANRLVVEGGANCPPLCREDPNGANSLVANTKELGNYVQTRGADNVRQNLDGMSFNPALPANGTPLGQLFVRFSISAYTHWDYDANSGRYLRFQDIQEATDLASEAYEPLVDRTTNQQIAADNVGVLIAPHQFVFGTKPGPSEVVEINLTGSGPAYALRDGQVYEVVWNRAAKENLITLTFPDGTVYPFKPGATWFEVVGKSTKIDNQTTGILRFQHAIP